MPGPPASGFVVRWGDGFWAVVEVGVTKLSYTTLGLIRKLGSLDLLLKVAQCTCRRFVYPTIATYH